jgi:hypothetical protein
LGSLPTLVPWTDVLSCPCKLRIPGGELYDRYTVFVSGSQPTEGAQALEAKLQITGEAKLPR